MKGLRSEERRGENEKIVAFNQFQKEKGGWIAVAYALTIVLLSNSYILP
jgi:hypothetical protein